MPGGHDVSAGGGGGVGGRGARAAGRRQPGLPGRQPSAHVPAPLPAAPLRLRVGVVPGKTELIRVDIKYITL